MRSWLVWLLLVGGSLSASAAEPRPAVLFCNGADLTYLTELRDIGFEVDWIETQDEFLKLTWERIRHSNVIVLSTTPDTIMVHWQRIPSARERTEPFAALMERYLEAGGGILLMPMETNMIKQAVSELTDRWGARIPVERIEENNPANLAVLTHSGLPMAFTDQIPPSPVSAGVHGLWYPVMPAYNGQHSGPIAVDDTWQIVVTAAKTARTKPVDLATTGFIAPPNPFIRPQGVAAPALAAIRNWKAGRLALINQWPQYSCASGTKWIYNREVLSTGLNDRRSDLGRLLENLLHWLAEPSLNSGRLGGYVTAPEKLIPTSCRPEARRELEKEFWPQIPPEPGQPLPPESGRLFRGVIGVRSACSSGHGSVEGYAKAATAAGLDFLVFLEEYGRFTPESFGELKDDCRKFSTASLRLLPGFSIRSNVGDHVFFFANDPPLPPPDCLTGPGKTLLYAAAQDDKGNFTGTVRPGVEFMEWILNHYHTDGNVGYYNFTEAPEGVKMPTLRLYAMAALRYYRDGKLVEDVTDDYLKTAQSTIAPTPVSVAEILSPGQLMVEVTAGRGLTYAQASSLNNLMPEALRWSSPQDGMNVFPSDGPLIRRWPGCHRVITYGSEEFVPMPAVMLKPLHVTAEKGLKEIRIYNGMNLFRRFLCGGKNDFTATLALNATVQRNLVLVAEDLAGGKAVSFTSYNRKEGALAPVFCSDHLNDLKHTSLIHGPYNLPYNFSPGLPLSVAGSTWDGGNYLADRPLIHSATTPAIEASDRGAEDGWRFEQNARLEFSDEGALAVGRFHNDRVYDDRVKQVLAAYYTWGPLSGPSRLFAYNLRYREWVRPTIGPDLWPGDGVRIGANSALFTDEITFREEMTIRSMHLGYLTVSGLLVIGGEGNVFTVIDPARKLSPSVHSIQRGEWFGVYSTGVSASHLFINRGETICLENRGKYQFLYPAGRERALSRKVRKGDRYTLELASIGFPVNVKIKSPADFARYVDYLRTPDGLEIRRGKRLDGPGLIEIAPDQAVVEMAVPRPKPRLELTLPVRIPGFNPRWTAGLFQKQGYVTGAYGTGENRYRELGLDLDGTAYVPVYVDYADKSWFAAGHPVIAGEEGKDLFIQVTKLSETPPRWHVSVNNPLDTPVTTTLKTALLLRGLVLNETPMTFQPGEYRLIP